MAKTFKQKNFNHFVWTPLGSRVNIYINFCLQVHLKLSAAWYCCHYLPPVSTTPAANLPPVSTTLAKMVEKFATGLADTGGKFATGVVDTGGNFAAGVVDTGDKFATGVVDTGGATWLPNISANFRKNSKWSKWNPLELGGNWFMKKNQKQKISWHCPFKVLVTRVPYQKIRVVASVRDKMFVVANHRVKNNFIVSLL